MVEEDNDPNDHTDIDDEELLFLEPVFSLDFRESLNFPDQDVQLDFRSEDARAKSPGAMVYGVSAVWGSCGECGELSSR